MRKLVNATYVTLDGDMTKMEAWHFDFFSSRRRPRKPPRGSCSPAMP
jgi:hypothetical protein